MIEVSRESSKHMDNSIVTSYKKIVLVILLFTSVDTILFGTNGNTFFNYIPRLMALIGVILLIPKKHLIVDGSLVVCFTMIGIVSVSNTLRGTEFATSISRILVILLAFAIVAMFNIYEFFEIYDLFMYVVSIMSIILYLFTLFLPSVVLHLPSISNMANSQFFTCFFSSISAESVARVYVPRASGIFWEAGAFSVYLAVAIMYQLFIASKVNMKRLIVFMIMLLLTFSTTGFIAVGTLIFTFTFTKRKNGKWNVWARIFSLFLIVLIIVLLLVGKNTVLYQALFGKIINGESTALTRYASFIVPFRIVGDFPVFGVSAGQISDYMKMYALKPGIFGAFQSSTMCTNTISYQFGTYGICMGMLFVIGTWRFAYKISNKKIIVAVGLFMTFFFAYFGENFFSFFSYVFVFYGYRKRGQAFGDN